MIDQQLAAAHEILHVGRQRGEIAQPAEDRIASSRRMPSGPCRAGLAAPSKAVFAVAEKGEVVVVEPAQEILSLGEFGGGNRRRLRRQFV